MSVIQLHQLENFAGWFGNRLHLYASGRKLAEVFGATLQTGKWEGQMVFDIDDPPIVPNDPNRILPEPCETIHCYSDAHNLYCRDDARRYLKIKPELISVEPTRHPVVAHLRRGDFMLTRDWPQVSESDLIEAIARTGTDVSNVQVLSDGMDHARTDRFDIGKYIPDFLTMMYAENLFVYPYSSFSKWAAILQVNGRAWVPHNFTTGPTKVDFKLWDGDVRK